MTTPDPGAGFHERHAPLFERAAIERIGKRVVIECETVGDAEAMELYQRGLVLTATERSGCYDDFPIVAPRPEIPRRDGTCGDSVAGSAGSDSCGSSD